MKTLIYKNIQGQKVLLSFIVTNIVYMFMITVTIPNVVSYADGMQLLDMKLMGYDAAYVQVLLDTLGAQGRQAYLYWQLPVDMIYPLTFAVSYSLLLAYFLNKLNKLDSSLFYLCILPIVAGLSDYMENIGTITMLIQYPDVSTTLARTNNVFTLIKSASSTIYFVVLIVTLLVFGVSAITRMSKKT